MVLRGIFIGIAIRTRIAGMTQDVKSSGTGFGVADNRGMMRIHPNTELLLVF